jgi:hypothetical protein
MNLRRAFAMSTLMLAALAARAHDTWFQSPVGAASGLEVRLGTGNRFPVYETGIGAEYLELQGCRGPRALDAERPMVPVRNDDHALVLRLRPQALSCWAQLVPLGIELGADKVSVYLREVQASAEVRGLWRQMQAQGLPWKERYTKHARIDWAAAPGAPSTAAPMAMDIVRTAGASNGWHFQVLKGGLPLAGQAMELISESATQGIWRRTDDQGRVSWPALPSGRWLLRGTQLQRSGDDPTRWDSGFVTLAFEVPTQAVSIVNSGRH